jgi:hypothetical protein
MLTKMIGLAAAFAVGTAAMASATSASAKSRIARAPAQVRAPAAIPPPAYGFRRDGRAHSSNPAHDVYVDGKYAGSDPDPFIRSRLAHDPPWNYTR